MQLSSSSLHLRVICLRVSQPCFVLFLSSPSPSQQHHPCSSLCPLFPLVSRPCHGSCVFCPMFTSSSLPSKLFPLCLMEVEPYEGTARRRPVSLCPCWSPEGNVTLPPLMAGVAVLPWQPCGPTIQGSAPCCCPGPFTPYPSSCGCGTEHSMFPTCTFKT